MKSSLQPGSNVTAMPSASIYFLIFNFIIYNIVFRIVLFRNLLADRMQQNASSDKRMRFDPGHTGPEFE